MRILGLDLGSRTVGIAISDSNESLALMRETFRFDQDDYVSACNKVLEYIDRYRIKTVVLGLPKHLNNDIGERAKISLAFKEMIQKERDVEVIMEDERLTTVMALNTLAGLHSNASKRKKTVDQMAAATILQSYLDRKKRGTNE